MTREIRECQRDPKKNPTRLSADLLYVARNYFMESRACYESDEDHWLEIKAFFEWIFGLNDVEEQRPSQPKKGSESKSSARNSTHGSKGKGSSSKGVNRATAVWGSYAVLQNKNAPGLAGEASLQGAVWYGEHCRSMKGVFKHSKLPAILIGVVGNVLEVSIAICLEEVVVDKILYFEVLNSVHNNETIIKLALIAWALKTCARKLWAEYREFQQTSVSGQVEEDTWSPPCPSPAAPSPNSLIPVLKFKSKLSQSNEKPSKPKGENSEMRPLFLATYDDREVPVKFTVRYNVGAHVALADRGYAPKLYACEQIIDGLQMVVTERVGGRRMLDEPGHSLPCSLFEDLEKALKIIHDKGLVFGDLRNTNVMIVKGDTRVEAKLVNFDWINEDQKGRYPALINTDLIGTELAPDVHQFGFMYKKHDKYALSRLISKCADAVYRKIKCEEL